jgi:hypothetical protein
MCDSKIQFVLCSSDSQTFFYLLLIFLRNIINQLPSDGEVPVIPVSLVEIVPDPPEASTDENSQKEQPPILSEIKEEPEKESDSEDEEE